VTGPATRRAFSSSEPTRRLSERAEEQPTLPARRATATASTPTRATTTYDDDVMGASASAMPAPCGRPPVTANPTTAKLTPRDASALRDLYGHDDELFQLMCGAELLRDCAKNVRDDAAAYFHAMSASCAAERKFGEKLQSVADTPNVSGVAAHLAAAARADDAEGETSPFPRGAAGGGGSDPRLRAALQVSASVGELARAEVDASAAHDAFVETFLEKMKDVAARVEKAHNTKLETCARARSSLVFWFFGFLVFWFFGFPLPAAGVSLPRRDGRRFTFPNSNSPRSSISAALAHEKAFRQVKPPEHRLEHLMNLDDEQRESPECQKKIDVAEVELEKRKAQVAATSKMLKIRARLFLDTYTPYVRDAISAFAVAQHDAHAAMARAIGRSVGGGGGGVDAARRECAWFLDAEPGAATPKVPVPSAVGEGGEGEIVAAAAA